MCTERPDLGVKYQIAEGQVFADARPDELLLLFSSATRVALRQLPEGARLELIATLVTLGRTIVTLGELLDKEE